MMVNSALAGGWGELLPLSINLPSRAKLWYTLQLRGQRHSSYFSSPFLPLWIWPPFPHNHRTEQGRERTKPAVNNRYTRPYKSNKRSRDGILGHNFDKKIQVSWYCYSQSLKQADFCKGFSWYRTGLYTYTPLFVLNVEKVILPRLNRNVL